MNQNQDHRPRGAAARMQQPPGRLGLPDIRQLRDDARAQVENGALTEDYRADVDRMVDLLQRSMAMEIVCWLRYSQHALVATGIRAEAVAKEFREHAAAELSHSERLARRIVQIGGEPDLSPQTLAGSEAWYSPGLGLRQMIVENLVEERVAIEWYRLAIQEIGDDDPTSRRLLETILADEEEHADELASFIRTEHDEAQPRCESANDGSAS